MVSCSQTNENRSEPVPVTTPAEDGFKYLALGDSYTIGESVEPEKRWPVQLADKIEESGIKTEDPKIIARTGWTTDELKAAILADNPDSDYDLVSLLIGVNNQYRGRSLENYKMEFEELLNMAISYAGNDPEKVIVVSIPDYGYTPFGESNQEEISREIDEFNAANKAIAEQKGVKYFNITDISREGLVNPSLVASDKLHPSGEQYRLWVERIFSSQKFQEILEMAK